MTRPLRRKHQKSSLQRTTQPSSRKTPPTKRLPLTHPLIASKWDKKLTLAQNYRRLGLSSKLNIRSGGVEKVRKVRKSRNGLGDGAENKGEEELEEVMEEERDGLANLGGDVGVLGKRKRGQGVGAGVGVTKVIRDEQGKIVSVVRAVEDSSETNRRGTNPLNDPLLHLDNDSDSSSSSPYPTQPAHIPQHSLPAPSSDRISSHSDPSNTASSSSPRTTSIIPALTALASVTPKASTSRHQQSEYEKSWIARLVSKHGDDIAAMSRDRKMNPKQQTEVDIGRRVRIWREAQGDAEGAK